MFDQAGQRSPGRYAAIPGFLLRNAADLADEHLAVEVKERFQHLPLGAGGDPLIGGKRRIRLRSRHGTTVAVGARQRPASAIWGRRSGRADYPAQSGLP